jgi:hypothetical protein
MGAGGTGNKICPIGQRYPFNKVMEEAYRGPLKFKILMVSLRPSHN